MLVTTKEMLKKAKEGHFAIPAANFIDLDTMRWHVELAEKLGLPLILAVTETHMELPDLNLDDAVLLGRKYAEEASVPIALHLDHGMTPSLVKKAVDLGFSSVMIDASMEDFEENIRITKDIVDYAHAKGVSVEAEIGHVGAGNIIGAGEGSEEDSKHTSAEAAARFEKETGVDSLAISIGTAHGLYKGTPKINFERLAEIFEATEIPLVLHGGSSSGDENLSKCAKGGIAKINIYTDLIVGAVNELKAKNPENYFEVKASLKEGVQKTLEHYYRVFGTQKI